MFKKIFKKWKLEYKNENKIVQEKSFLDFKNIKDQKNRTVMAVMQS